MSTLSFAGVFIATLIAKNWIKPKFGPTGVHFFAFILALIVVSVTAYSNYNPKFSDLLYKAGEYLIAAVALYEIIIKKFEGLFTKV